MAINCTESEAHRTLFGCPIRKDTTELFFPYKISLDEFIEYIRNVDGFAENLRRLGSKYTEDRFIEEWAETYLAYCEIEEER